MRDLDPSMPTPPHPVSSIWLGAILAMAGAFVPFQSAQALDLREAYELAVYALVREGSQEPVKAGFLNAFIEQVISEGAKA